MQKKFLTFGILLIVFVGVFAPIVSMAQGVSQTTFNGLNSAVANNQAKISATAAAADPNNKALSDKAAADLAAANKAKQEAMTGESDWSLAGWIWTKFAQGIGYALITISSLALLLSGWIFDEVVKFSIIEMAKNIGDPNGVGGAITLAWATLRDIANMCFIFVLLYAAFKAMFDTNFSGFGTTVKNIIIVALLINFSLFFSKVVIDASNIVAVGFYNSITNNTVTYNTNTTTGSSFEKTISAGYMNMLGLQTFFGANILDGKQLTDGSQILTVGIITAVFMLITAVILLIAGIMFAARFIILIFLMILSPLALIAYIIPGMKGKFDEWFDALINQSFFAPLYFALTWVVFKLSTSLIGVLGKKPGVEFSEITTNPQGVMPLIINYVLIIGFSIAALIFAKTMASKTAGFKAISGGIGTATIGGVALVGRNVIGRGSSLVSEKYRDQLSKTSYGRAGLWLANKGGKASFDARGIADTKYGKAVGASKLIDKDVVGKVGGVGGFAKAVKDKEEAKSKYAKEVYGQTDFEKDEAKKLEDKYKVEKYAEEERIKNKRKKDAKDELDTARASGDTARIKAAENYEREVESKNKNKIFTDDEYLNTFKDGIKAEYEKYAKAGERRQGAYAKRLESTANIITAAGSVTGAIVGGVAGGIVGGIPGVISGASLGAGVGSTFGRGNKTAARKIRLESKGPSKEKRLADAYKAIADTDTDTTAPTTPVAPVPAAAPTAPTPPSGGGSNRFE